MQYILYILAIPFVWLNYKIIVSDFQKKIIPNKFLGYLLVLIPVYYIYSSIYLPEIHYLGLVFQGFFSLCISFGLYYFNIWAAWDAKYMFTLSLFLLDFSIISFFGNMWLVVFIVLFIWFFYFYLQKMIGEKNYITSLGHEIKNDIRSRLKHYSQSGNIYLLLMRGIILFLLLFMSIRLLRIFLFDNAQEYWVLSHIFWSAYNLYFLVLFFLFFIAILWWGKKLFEKIHIWLSKISFLSPKIVSYSAMGLLICILFWYILSLYQQDSIHTQNLLFRIFTLYLGIYIVFQIVIYASKITFWHTQARFQDIKYLQAGNMIDRKNIADILGNQKVLWAHDNTKWPLYPDPKRYFLTLENPLDRKSVVQIKQYIQLVNDFYDKNPDPNITSIRWVQVLQTISFAHYIFIGFLLSYLYQDQIISWLTSILLDYLNVYT